jgi:predicted transcriptional regulator
VPVLGDEGLVGIVSEADLLNRRGERAEEVMSLRVVTTRPSATLTEAARAMRRSQVKRLPVVDASGRLVGIVSRADLLKALLRSDADIGTEIKEQVIEETLWIDPAQVDVRVEDGIVTLRGQLDTRSLCRILVRMTEAISGVVRVHDQLSYRLDDTHLAVEAPAGSLQYSAEER